MRSTKGFVLVALLVAGALVLFLAPAASTAPDGLEKVAADQDFAGAARESRAVSGPLAGYSVSGTDARVGTGTAGIIGIVVTFGLGLAVSGAVRAARSRSGSA